MPFAVYGEPLRHGSLSRSGLLHPIGGDGTGVWDAIWTFRRGTTEYCARGCVGCGGDESGWGTSESRASHRVDAHVGGGLLVVWPVFLAEPGIGGIVWQSDGAECDAARVDHRDAGTVRVCG